MFYPLYTLISPSKSVILGKKGFSFEETGEYKEERLNFLAPILVTALHKKNGLTA
jgi:hypothetical protein